MSALQRFPLVGLDQEMVLVVGDFYTHTQRIQTLLLLDTGASITALTSRTIRRLGLDWQEPCEVIKTHIWGDTVETPILVVPRVRVFGQEVRDLEVAYGCLPPALKIDGVLGLNFLRHFDLRVNFREEYVELR